MRSVSRRPHNPSRQSPPKEMRATAEKAADNASLFMFNYLNKMISPAPV